MNNLLSLKNFDYNLLKVLEAIILNGNSARAAEHLQVTPAAISQALRRLQNNFSEALFIRNKNGLVATARAKEIHHAFSQANVIIKNVLDLNFPKNDSKSIKILCKETAENRYIIPAYENLYATGYLFSIVSDVKASAEEHREMLITGNIDMMIGCKIVGGDSLKSMCVEGDDIFTVVCSGNNALSQKKV